jgi:hypothetical protein
LEYFQKLIKGTEAEVESYKSSHAYVVKQANELVATSTHHDTITGTSPTFVI